MEKATTKIIQISDMHILADRAGALLGVTTEESFQAVLTLLKQHTKDTDLILLSGDISQDGSAEAYTRVGDMLKEFNLPTYFFCGNHDHPTVIDQVYPYATIASDKHIVLKNWHLILLNSQKVGAVEGYLDESQLKYLETCLKAFPDHHAIIAFHHHPIPVGCAWLDKIGLTNAAQFWELVARYPKVNSILFGHAHQEVQQVKNGIKCFGVPSTCIQFKRNQDHFGLEKLSPGFRWVELYEDGRLETAVERAPEYIGIFEADAKGY